MTGDTASGRPRVLVTGAAGRLGSTVAARFHDEGLDLLATDVVNAPGVPYRFEQADLLDHRVALSLLDDIDVLVHIANHPGIRPRPPQLAFNENLAMNQNMFQGAAERGVGRIVFASTLQLIGSHPDRRTVVDEPPRPRYPIDATFEATPSNVYALSKQLSETMLRYYATRCAVDCVAIRFPMLHRWEQRACVRAGEEDEVDVFEGFTGLTYDDAAELIVAVLRTDLPGYRVYAPGSSHRHRDLSIPELIRTYYPDVPPDVPDLIDVSAITEQTGWRPTPPPDRSDEPPDPPTATSEAP